MRIPPRSARIWLLISCLLACPVVAGAQPKEAPKTKGLNLEGKDLRKTDVAKLNLRGANLRKANLEFVDLTKLDLTGANLQEAKLNSAKFVDADLTGTDLREAEISGTDFTRTILAKANLEGLDLTGSTHVYQTNFQGANLRKTKFFKFNAGTLDLRGADLRGANLREALDIAKAKLKGARYNKDTQWPTGFEVGETEAKLDESLIVPEKGK